MGDTSIALKRAYEAHDERLSKGNMDIEEVLTEARKGASLATQEMRKVDKRIAQVKEEIAHKANEDQVASINSWASGGGKVVSVLGNAGVGVYGILGERKYAGDAVQLASVRSTAKDYRTGMQGFEAVNGLIQNSQQASQVRDRFIQDNSRDHKQSLDSLARDCAQEQAEHLRKIGEMDSSKTSLVSKLVS